MSPTLAQPWLLVGSVVQGSPRRARSGDAKQQCKSPCRSNAPACANLDLRQKQVCVYSTFQSWGPQVYPRLSTNHSLHSRYPTVSLRVPEITRQGLEAFMRSMTIKSAQRQTLKGSKAKRLANLALGGWGTKGTHAPLLRQWPVRPRRYFRAVVLCSPQRPMESVAHLSTSNDPGLMPSNSNLYFPNRSGLFVKKVPNTQKHLSCNAHRLIKKTNGAFFIAVGIFFLLFWPIRTKRSLCSFVSIFLTQTKQERESFRLSYPRQRHRTCCNKSYIHYRVKRGPYIRSAVTVCVYVRVYICSSKRHI